MTLAASSSDVLGGDEDLVKIGQKTLRETMAEVDCASVLPSGGEPVNRGQGVQFRAAHQSLAREASSRTAHSELDPNRARLAPSRSVWVPAERIAEPIRSVVDFA